MPAPFAPNTTCDIYRPGNTPPANPDVAAVNCHLEGNYARGLERGEGDAVAKKFTHILLVAIATDIRDDYDNGTIGNNADMVYIPDKTGTPFRVIFTEIVLQGNTMQHKRVFISRKAPTWPTTQL